MEIAWLLQGVIKWSLAVLRISTATKFKHFERYYNIFSFWGESSFLLDSISCMILIFNLVL